MPHKITLTGKPVSSLRSKGAFHTFDMEEKGSPGPPKGLPKSSMITYTVFINAKQLKKAGLTEENIRTQKIMVQGEPTLDVPIEDCPGEIGVTCFQISVIPEKQKEAVKASEEPVKEAVQVKPEPVQEEVKAEAEPVKAEMEKEVKQEEVKEAKKPKAPEGTEDFISLKQISVPEEFLNSHPNPHKTQKVIDYVKKTGCLDEPITINRDNVLTDGYRRYIVAQKLEMDMVPVMYEKTSVENV